MSATGSVGVIHLLLATAVCCLFVLLPRFIVDRLTAAMQEKQSAVKMLMFSSRQDKNHDKMFIYWPFLIFKFLTSSKKTEKSQLAVFQSLESRVYKKKSFQYWPAFTFLMLDECEFHCLARYIRSNLHYLRNKGKEILNMNMRTYM